MTGVRGIDVPDRKLTPEERERRDAVLPALRAWTGYLDARGAHGDYPAAAAAGAPVVTRHQRRTGQLYSPLAVCPRYALDWARGSAHQRVGTGRALTYGAMVDALDFIGAVPATTFRPAAQAAGVRRVEGWFRLAAEHHARLRQGVYVPVLTGLPGRRRRDRMPVTPVRRDRMASVDRSADMTVTMLRDYLRTARRTALFEVATREGLPLVPRRPGRPPRGRARGLLVRTGCVLVSDVALAAHVQEFAYRLQLERVPTHGDVVAGLRAHAAANPQVFAAAATFSAWDCGQRRKQRHWWRVELAGLGLPDNDPVELLPDLEVRERIQEEGASGSGSAGGLHASGDRAPAGVRPEDMTPEERDWYGVLLDSDR